MNNEHCLLTLLLIEDGRVRWQSSVTGTNEGAVLARAHRELWESKLQAEVLESGDRPKDSDFEALTRWAVENSLTQYTLEEIWAQDVTQIESPPMERRAIYSPIAKPTFYPRTTEPFEDKRCLVSATREMCKLSVAKVENRHGDTVVVIPPGCDFKAVVFDEFCAHYWDELKHRADFMQLSDFLQKNDKAEAFDFYFQREDESCDEINLELPPASSDWPVTGMFSAYLETRDPEVLRKVPLADWGVLLFHCMAQPGYLKSAQVAEQIVRQAL